MKFFIFRNTTVEPFFIDFKASFSGYEDISSVPTDVDGYIWFYLLPIKQDSFLLSQEVFSYYNNLELIVNEISPAKPLYIFTFATLYENNVETGDYKLQEAINLVNNKIYLLSGNKKSIRVIDIQMFFSKFQAIQLIDWKYYYLSKILLNPKLAGSFNNWLNAQINAIEMKRKKCLILDLDNTLWGGVLGEDGINGIKTGGDYPGNAFLDFQKSILQLHNAGVILAVCSKNNEADVIEAWAKNPFILIRPEHLATYRINWNNKAQNISEIIEQLNIGSDSVVFIDDNPTERELVKQFLPMVEVPDFPVQPYMLPVFIKEVTQKYFSIYRLTDEDKAKTKQYQANNERELFQHSFSNFSDYLSSLEMDLMIQSASEITIPRIAQMSQKTNQFNLTTKRYTEADIYAFLEKGCWVYTISVKDRFGDSGITGLIIIQLNNENRTAEIDSFLLSCRILGKGIEHAFINAMLNKLKGAGFEYVNASYVRTLKNEQVRSFYENLGFEILNLHDNNEELKKYTLKLDEKEFEVKPFYKILIDE